MRFKLWLEVIPKSLRDKDGVAVTAQAQSEVGRTEVKRARFTWALGMGKARQGCGGVEL